MTNATIPRSDRAITPTTLGATIQRITRETIVLTPEMAKKFLDLNSENRPITEPRVADYARQIAAGLWKYNPGDAALSFDANGVLLNGQHRCYAVIAANTPIRVDVVWGLDTNLREVFDTGRARSAADVLSMKDESNAALLAAMAALHFRHLQASRRHAAGLPYRLSGGRYSPTNQEIAACVHDYPLMRGSFGATRVLEPRKLIRPAVAGWLHFRLSELDQTKTEEFWGQLATGLGIDAESPLYVLRRNLLNRMGSRGGSQSEQEMTAAITFKAWNLWLTGTPAKLSVWRPDSEPFPQPLTIAQASASISRGGTR